MAIEKTTIGPYELLDVLGKGGLGIVYRAKLGDDRIVAIKVMPKPHVEDTTDFMRRFKSEAELTSSMSHPHIIKTLDYGEHENLTYIVMELMSGGSLKKRLSGNPLPLPEAARIFEEIGSALDYAHEQAIVHRDMKPDNVLLDANGTSYLSDFGLVKITDGDTTQVPSQEGVLRGTPLYMSPEQWVAEMVDKRTDLYSLGVMLFEMLTGKLPFYSEDTHALMQLHIYEPPPSLLALRPDLPPGLETVLEKALAKDRRDRYNTAGEFVAAFKAKITNQKTTLTLVPSIQLGRPVSAQPQQPADLVTEANPAPIAASPVPTAPPAKSRARKVLYGLFILALFLGLIFLFLLRR